ncbi:hypothetical protein ACRALDRAFT_1059708 [Sodiomyces alcalophilus JCM 7366]|uniref:uncharacterized protein n=1 Tax=Sodiomyces alcalophilus JCM 7366 TaxID=591952 RepID=UPI0039B4A816
MTKSRKKKKSRPKPKTAGQPGFVAEPQGESMFFQVLPQELRNKIYSHVFFSTRLAYGDRALGRIDCVRIRPAPNALALLKTCRRAKMEIGNTWISQVLFSFEDPETMLDKLTALPTPTLTTIRHVRVLGDPLMLSFEDDDVYYRLASTLRLLPGLRLDILTVLGTRMMDVSYDTLDGLIRESCGWRELRYISHRSDVLGFAKPDLPDFFGDEVETHRYWRKPQPAHWQNVLEDRDGAPSKPSVTIYRSTVSDHPGSVLNSSRRTRFEQKAPQDRGAREAFGLTEDAELMADGEITKELMVVVKRGSGVDYEEKKDSPFIGSDIRRDIPGKTWKEIRHKYIDHLGLDDDDSLFAYCEDDEDEDHITEVDTYEDVDEYVWPPLHFEPKKW